MNPNDPNVPALELVVGKLGALTSELVLVGGCSVGLLITDRTRPPVRPTEDVDMVTQVVTLPAVYQTLERLRACGFNGQMKMERISCGGGTATLSLT